MTNKISTLKQAILLLTSHFSKSDNNGFSPLTNTEWKKFALWLHEHNLTPEHLLINDPKEMLANWHDPKITLERITALLNRGHSLALALEKWQRAGIWIITRSDAEYPQRLKQHLKASSPPVLFGCGNPQLLNIGGLAVVGSRNASPEDLLYTENIGKKAASEQIAIVSGGARGVDETAMLSAISHQGVTIGIMADSLLRAVTSQKWRQGLMNNRCVLISPFYPEAGFNSGNAMARNRYIYCLSDACLVVHSGKKGGTWSGAEENLRHQWVPLWVKLNNDVNSANGKKIKKGGLLFNENWSLKQIIETKITNDESQLGLFAPLDETSNEEPHTPEHLEMLNTETAIESYNTTSTPYNIDFYKMFLKELPKLTQDAITLENLIKRTNLSKSQLNEWLKLALEKGVIRKLAKPVRYISASH